MRRLTSSKKSVTRARRCPRAHPRHRFRRPSLRCGQRGVPLLHAAYGHGQPQAYRSPHRWHPDFRRGGCADHSALICVGLVANVSGMMWIGSRVTEAMGTTYPKLGLLAGPARPAFLRGATLSICRCFMLLFFKPNDIVNYVSSVLWFWSLLAVLGVIVLRFASRN